MQTFTGQFYINEKTYTLRSQVLFPRNGPSNLSESTKFLLKVTSVTKQLLKMCHLKHSLTIFFFQRKMFCLQDIQVFVFLSIP